jgi:hypothetical protein
LRKQLISIASNLPMSTVGKGSAAIPAEGIGVYTWKR